jgi:thymidylate kinase
LNRLDVAVSLFAAIDDRAVKYAQWKSNEHLDAALRGETDLDLLVAPESRTEFEGVLRELGFVPMRVQRALDFPGREAHLGFDDGTGGFIHLDVHYRLILGEQWIKNYHLPVETWLMEGTTSLGGVRVPIPSRELLILYWRAMMKTGSRQVARAALRRESPLPPSTTREVQWLSDRVDDQDLEEAAASSRLPITAEELTGFRTRVNRGNLTWAEGLRRRHSIARRFAGYRRRPRAVALARQAAIRLRISPPLDWLGLGIRPKTLTAPAPLIAVVGADGSGKSSLCGDLHHWLGWKLWAHHVYFGQPKSGLVFKALNKPGSHSRKLADRAGGTSSRPGSLRSLARVTDALKWVYLARRRKRLYGAAISRCRRGQIVIAERYPLKQFFDAETPMDGPRIDPAAGTIERVLARLELREYQAIGEPDLLIILDTDIETLRARKSDLGLSEHEGKVLLVKSIDASERISVIDAGRPYPEVLLQAKQLIWRSLLEAN